jgi:hypothetical protein
VDTLVVKEDAKSKMDASVNIPIAQPEAAIPETAVQKANPYSIPLGMHNPSGPTPIPQIVSRNILFEQMNRHIYEMCLCRALQFLSGPLLGSSLAIQYKARMEGYIE